MMEAHERSHHRFAEQSGVSCAMVLTAYPALSPVTGLFCHRRFADHPQNLTPASGRQDHTALPYALASLVLRRRRVHRIPPHVRTIAKRPFSKGGTGRSSKDDLPDGTIEIFFRWGLDDPNHVDPTGEFSPKAR